MKKESHNHIKLLLAIAALTALLLIGKVITGMSQGFTIQECFKTKQEVIDSWILSGMDRHDNAIEDGKLSDHIKAIAND